MSANYRNYRRPRRQENIVPVGAFSPWLLVALIAVLIGVTWVYYKNQLHQRGEEIRRMEQKLALLSRKNEALKSGIALLSTDAALQKYCANGTIQMVKINSASVIRIDVSRRDNGTGEDLRVASAPFPGQPRHTQ